MDTETLRTSIAAEMPRTVSDLETLVRIPSIGHPGHDPAQVRASAEATARILREAGLEDVRLIELGDGAGHPAVFGELPAPEGAPTALLYAHHDVQPEGRPPSGHRRRSSRSSATAGCTAAAPPTTRPAS